MSLGAREQLSFLGRALPYPTERKIRDSWKEHQRVYSTHFACQAPLLERAAHWSKIFFSMFSQDDLSFSLSTPEFTEGACLEKTRKEGGLSAHIVELLQSEDEEKTRRCQEILGQLPASLEPIEREQLAASIGIRETLFATWKKDHEEKATEQQIPWSQVESVPERGFKCRTVTKSEGTFVALLHYVRGVVLRKLRRHVSISDVLAGDHRKAVEDMLQQDGGVRGPLWFRRGEPTRVLVSADLTAASDLLPHDLCRAVWSGLIDDPRTEPMVADLVAQALGP